MNVWNWAALIALIVLIALVMKPLGIYLGKILDPKEKTFLGLLFKPLEKLFYKACGIDPLAEQSWQKYLFSLLSFSFASFLLTALLLSLQFYLPLNPQGFASPSWGLNLNTSISYMTNTNWQSYGGEWTMSYFSQMAALTVQNFTSAAVGLGAAAVFVRGIARKSSETVGNFWADLIRSALYLFLPLAILSAAFFITQGVPQNFQSYEAVHTLDGDFQIIAEGPIASQEAIKMLGSSGGGFMNTNSAHPYENPTPLSNAAQIFFLLLIPASQIYYFGRALKDTRHAWSIAAALMILFAASVIVCTLSESAGSPELAKLGIEGGNWEGKETRFGIFGSSLFSCAAATTSSAAGNCALDSMTPLTGAVLFLNMQLGELIFGGVGVGLCRLLLFILLATFAGHLLIGKSPQYFGKRIELKEIKLVLFAILPYITLIYGLTGLSCSSAWGVSQLLNPGPHGFSEMLYAFTSASLNNGGAFKGLEANTVPYNLFLAAAMLLGRFFLLVPVIALGGFLARKEPAADSEHFFMIPRTAFIFLLMGTILFIGALAFLPALIMGPVLEQIAMLKGALFS